MDEFSLEFTKAADNDFYQDLISWLKEMDQNGRYSMLDMLEVMHTYALSTLYSIAEIDSVDQSVFRIRDQMQVHRSESDLSDKEFCPLDPTVH